MSALRWAQGLVDERWALSLCLMQLQVFSDFGNHSREKTCETLYMGVRQSSGYPRKDIIGSLGLNKEPTGGGFDGDRVCEQSFPIGIELLHQLPVPFLL